MSDYVKSYTKALLEDLRCYEEEFKKRQLLDKQAEEARLAHFRETSVPLVVRVNKLTASIPEAERFTPKSLEWFRTRLKGRLGRSVHAAELGDALRKLGYVRKRSWSDHENGYRAMWYLNKK